MIRKRSRDYLLHLVVPLVGFGIIGYVLTQADTNAKVGGVVWLAVGRAGVPVLPADRTQP